MDDSDLQRDAQKLLEQMKALPPREPGDKLRPSDEPRILDLREQGQTQEQIAAEIGCHQSTVSRTIAEYDDSRGLARRLLNAKAYAMAQRFIDEAKPAEVLRMMGKLDVVRDDRAETTTVGVRVVLGVPGGLADVFGPEHTLVSLEPVEEGSAPGLPSRSGAGDPID